MDAHRKARNGGCAVLPRSPIHLPLRSHHCGGDRHLQRAGLRAAGRRGNHSEGAVARVHNIDIPVLVHGDAVQIIEPRGDLRAVHIAKASGGVAGEGGHGIGRYPGHDGWRDHTHGVVVRDIKITAAIHHDAVGAGELRRRSRAVEAPLHASRSGDGAHDPGGSDHADGVVVRIRHIHIAVLVHRHRVGVIEARRIARAVDGSRAAGGVSGEGAHHSARCDLADGVVALVGHIDIAAAIQREARGEVKLRRAARAIKAAVGARASGEGVHHPGGRNQADGVVALVGHINIAAGIHRHARGVIKQRRVARAVGGTGNTGASRKGCHIPLGCDLADDVVG